MSDGLNDSVEYETDHFRRDQAPKPRFVIVNDSDAPQRNNIAEFVHRIGYCYMARTEEKMRKGFDGMEPVDPTPLEDFGFIITIDEHAGTAHFVKEHDETAVYKDAKGGPRKWQDVRKDFILPLVRGVVVKGEQHNRRASMEERSVDSEALEMICQYIERDSQCFMPMVVGETKHDYGVRLLKTLANELRVKFGPVEKINRG